MEKIQAEMGLSAAQVEHEGRGYVQSDDVVNAGFLQGETSHVAVQVVYDELAVLDDYDGVEVTPITRELSPKHPLALNLMRITVDGEPIDDPGRSLADIQRCTDVALEKADIQFRFDDLEADAAARVTSQPIAAPVAADSGTAPPVRFRMYTNYPYFIDALGGPDLRAGAVAQAEPLAVVPVGRGRHRGVAARGGVVPGTGARRSSTCCAATTRRGTSTRPHRSRSGWCTASRPRRTRAERRCSPATARRARRRGTSRSAAPAPSRVHGSGIPPRAHRSGWPGAPVPVDEHGNFVGEVILPSGVHTVEVAVLDEAGNGELFLRDLEFPRKRLVLRRHRRSDPGAEPAAAASRMRCSGRERALRQRLVGGRPARLLSERQVRRGLEADGERRHARGPVKDLFSNFLDKSPESLFRRIDPDYSLPDLRRRRHGRGDGADPGQVLRQARARTRTTRMWGNFKVGYLDNELAQVDRGLYGGNVHYQSLVDHPLRRAALALDGFAAEPGTVPSREEFRGTGGSLYYLRRQDLLTGSERVRIEIRDKDSGLVTGVVHLRPTLDYDIDYLQGRILLTEPLPAAVGDDLLVRNQGLSGDEAWLVVAVRVHARLRRASTRSPPAARATTGSTTTSALGLTASHDKADGDDSTLYAGDVTLRMSTDSWLKVQAGRSEGLVSTSSAPTTAASASPEPAARCP